jgi:two-component system sensor histidine kinase/response regulator
LLKQFGADFQSFGEQARQFICDNKREDVQRLAHSLKGVAASLGALRVADAASDLEQVLRRGEPAEPALERVERELRPMMSGLARHFGVNLSATSSPRVAGQFEQQLSSLPLPEWVNDLRRLLNDGDIAAQQLWERRGEELKSLLPARTYGHLRRALENFEFEAALEALSRSKGGA